VNKTYLLDTCIWRDFYEGKRSRSGKPLGTCAGKLFMKVLKEKRIIVFSESLVRELGKDYSLTDIHDMLGYASLTGMLKHIPITQQEYQEARELSRKRNSPFVDCLCAVQARNHGAILVNVDKHFFEHLGDVCCAYRPQDLI
jgi:predicted nucleic acid-binding protein